MIPKPKKDHSNAQPKSVSLEEIWQLEHDLKNALERLSFIEKVVLLHHFWNGKKLSEVADIIGKGHEATKKIELRAIQKLRDDLKIYTGGKLIINDDKSE